MSEGPRVVVVQAEGPRGFEELRAGVGVVPFDRDDRLHLGVVVKILLDLPALHGDPAPPSPSARPAHLWPEIPSRFGDPGSCDHPTDFVAPRDAAVVHVVGHARPPRPATSHVVRARVVDPRHGAVVDASRTTLAPSPSSALPLPALVARARGPIRDDAIVLLEGARGEGTVELPLPGLRPLVEVDQVAPATDDVPMLLDGLWIDLDEGIAAVVFRGALPVLAQTLDAVHRVVVSLERRGAERRRPQRLADLQRGDVAWAQVAERGAEPPPVDPEDPRIDAATVETWGAVAPEPRIPLPRFAQISAELAEDAGARGAVLERHGFTERRWMVEERAWLERMAVEAMMGDPTTSAVHGRLFADAQDALGTDAEGKVKLEEYAAVVVALDRAVDPAEVLEQVGWTLPFHARVERRFAREAERDPAVAERLRRTIEELAAAAGGDA